MKKYILVLCGIVAISAVTIQKKLQYAGFTIVPSQDTTAEIKSSIIYHYKARVDTNELKRNSLVTLQIPLRYFFVANKECIHCLMIDDHGLSSESKKTFTSVGIVTDKIHPGDSIPRYESIRKVKKTYDILNKDTVELIAIEPWGKIPEFTVSSNSIYFRNKEVTSLVFLR